MKRSSKSKLRAGLTFLPPVQLISEAESKPDVESINRIIDRVFRGEIVLPEFQRDFVWKRNRRKILDLLDSISRGYPIGSILLWEDDDRLLKSATIADLPVNILNNHKTLSYILDGQQRLTVICGALCWPGVSDPKSIWNIAYDLKSEKFVHLSTLGEPPRHMFRANLLREPIACREYIRRVCATEDEAYEQRGYAVVDRFYYYRIVTTALRNIPLDEAARIFERINSRNMKLTHVDLMEAATWRRDFDLTKSIDAIRDDLKKKGFDDIDRLVVLRNISRAAGHDFQAGSFDALRKDNTAKLKRAVRVTREAYRKAVDFLTMQIRVPGGAALPYSNQLTVLAEIFRCIPRPEAEQYAAIRQWFWKTAVSSYFAGWGTGAMANDQREIEKFAKGETAKLEMSAAKPEASIWKQRVFRLTNAHSKLLSILLAHRQPLDLLTGQPIDVARALSDSNVKEFHHFFPRKYLTDRGEAPERVNSLANFIMLTKSSNNRIAARAPSDYLTEVSRKAGSDLASRLESNLIPLTAYEAGLSDDFETFLDERARHVHEIILGNAGWL